MNAHRSDRAHIDLGLTDDELVMIETVLGRAPNDLELAMYAVMWSEHCSYKSSRIHLARLPTDGPTVLVGPGENAGVIDVGDGIAVAIRIESHNHPSFIEPFQGAATGVGGILRDIFTMGASHRPIAIMDPLFIGPLDDARSRYVFDGVVRGIAGYGNSVGVPTVGGQITFHRSYRANPLVNVFCLGVLPIERLVLGQASGEGNLAVLLGSRTGRDGIGGVSVLASAGFGSVGTESKRPSVQVGDPYEEKRLIEACLELLDRDLVVGIQDLGGAGITCATSETASRAGLGMDVDVDSVLRREPGMAPIEVMTSESQERMLAIVEPGSQAVVEEVCRRWEVEAAVIGVVRAADEDGVGRLRVRSGTDGPLLAEIPARSLAEDAPKYQRPVAAPTTRAPARPDAVVPVDAKGALLAMLVDSRWIAEQYDHQLFLNTVIGPGEGDAALLRLNAPGVPHTHKALGISVDGNPRWCAIDPRQGTAATVAESALNVACVGTTPAAVVNCLNFGNPEHPEVMWQLSESIDGMAERVAYALGLPVVGGNVSLYNESDGVDIEPTPVIATVGVLTEIRRRPPAFTPHDGDVLVLVGPTSDDLSGSAYDDGRDEAPRRLPHLDLDLHRRLVTWIADVVAAETAEDAPGLIHAIHDVSDGGLAVCLAELSVASGLGIFVEDATLGSLFSEASSRVVVTTTRPLEVIGAAAAHAIPAVVIGRVEGDRLVVARLLDVPVEALVRHRTARIPEALGEPTDRPWTTG